MNSHLIQKYNVPGPRYTSYPTVPYWDETPLTPKQWESEIQKSFQLSNLSKGMSLYIHLPYCESLCTYCGCNTRITINHQVEKPYIETLLKEWNLYLNLFEKWDIPTSNTHWKPLIKEIHLGGGTPTFFQPENLQYLIENILKSVVVHPQAEFSFEAHPNNTTAEHLKTLYKLGFRRLSLGIQDFDPKVQAIVHRIQSFEQVKKVTDEARQIGYTSINYDLMYGLPLQTLASVQDTIEKVNILRPHRIAFYSYAHVPWVKPSQRKFTEDDLPEDAEKRALYEMGKKMFIENGYIEIGMDHFALPSDDLTKAFENKTLHRNFMGYATHDTQLLIGLGVSSISDAWTAFAQNFKKVEDYQKAIHQGQLAIFRGHLLTEEDLILRKHILNIMCKFETEWSHKTDQTAFLEEALPLWEEMQKDGLLEVSPFRIRLTETGKPFVRNICMALDARLRRKQPSTQIFSKVI
jgi:oxygen-independent coproporphyrinogen III oxidase